MKMENVMIKEEICNSIAEADLSLDIQSSSYVGKEDYLSKFEVKQEVNKFYCEICYEEFKSNFEVDDHFKMKHSSVVETNNLNREELNFVKEQHKEAIDVNSRIHTSETLYKCEVCNKSLLHKSSLNKHKKIHTLETYACEVCNKSFVCKTYLQLHKRIHTGETPYECEVCNKRFSYKSSLNTHIRIHTGETPYECKVCNKKFSDSSTFRKHSKIHSGEIPYECDVCNKRFRQKGALLTHRGIHTGETPYKCEVCNKSFLRKDHLKRHFKIHRDA